MELPLISSLTGSARDRIINRNGIGLGEREKVLLVFLEPVSSIAEKDKH